MTEDIYSSKMYLARFKLALKHHKDYVWCPICTFEYDPFDCIDLNKYAGIGSRNLKCPRCSLRIGVMTLTRHFPFLVMQRVDF